MSVTQEILDLSKDIGELAAQLSCGAVTGAASESPVNTAKCFVDQKQEAANDGGGSYSQLWAKTQEAGGFDESAQPEVQIARTTLDNSLVGLS